MWLTAAIDQVTLLFSRVPSLSDPTLGNQARSISRRESTRSIKGRIPSSLEMASDSSNKDMALARWSRSAGAGRGVSCTGTASQRGHSSLVLCGFLTPLA
jgi:hypothetical protein